MVARQIHAMSPRAAGPFIAVNCGAIPRELMESEFFGHRRGSFTGAVSDKKGLFQEASGGTLFLDEVGDLPLAMQVKLLRAIQEKAVRPIGGTREEATDVRLLSATHNDLRTAVERGDFRSDLYYRINVIDLRVPALRERRDDIPLLVNTLLKRLTDDTEGTTRLDDQAMAALQGYNFPGNVRELENLLERALTLCEGQLITAKDLQLGPETGTTTPSPPPSALPDSAHPAFGQLDHYLETLERQALQAALAATDRNKTAAAELLGVSFRSMRYRLRKLEMD
jgi:two-component system response regulator PilR (NtrC family)